MDQATGSGTETGPTATRRQRDRTKTATRPPRSGKDSKELEGTTRRNRGHLPSGDGFVENLPLRFCKPVLFHVLTESRIGDDGT